MGALEYWCCILLRAEKCKKGFYKKKKTEHDLQEWRLKFKRCLFSRKGILLEFYYRLLGIIFQTPLFHKTCLLPPPKKKKNGWRIKLGKKNMKILVKGYFSKRENFYQGMFWKYQVAHVYSTSIWVVLRGKSQFNQSTDTSQEVLCHQICFAFGNIFFSCRWMWKFFYYWNTSLQSSGRNTGKATKKWKFKKNLKQKTSMFTVVYSKTIMLGTCLIFLFYW